MQDSTALWEAWRLSQAYHQTPSTIYHIEDEIAAYCFDRAVNLFGSSLQAELDEARNTAKNKQQAANKQQAVISKWLNVQRRFRDPAAGSGTASSSPDIVKL